MNITRLLYTLARASAWGNAIGKAASGNPKPITKRIRNKMYFKAFGRFLR